MSVSRGIYRSKVRGSSWWHLPDQGWNNKGRLDSRCCNIVQCQGCLQHLLRLRQYLSLQWKDICVFENSWCFISDNFTTWFHWFEAIDGTTKLQFLLVIDASLWPGVFVFHFRSGLKTDSWWVKVHPAKTTYVQKSPQQDVQYLKPGLRM